MEEPATEASQVDQPDQQVGVQPGSVEGGEKEPAPPSGSAVDTMVTLPMHVEDCVVTRPWIPKSSLLRWSTTRSSYHPCQQDRSPELS